MHTGTTKTDRERRRDAIVEVVRAHRVASQADLQDLLEKQGFRVNQPTLSRDLRDMRLRKGPDGYELPSDAPPAAEAAVADAPALQLWVAVREWMQSAVVSGQLFVLKTPPSGASPLAAALDKSGDGGLLGTIAGDDTVLGICATPAAARRITRHLQALGAEHGKEAAE